MGESSHASTGMRSTAPPEGRRSSAKQGASPVTSSVAPAFAAAAAQLPVVKPRLPPFSGAGGASLSARRIIAFTTAAATGLPPFGPEAVIHSQSSDASSSCDSAAPTKPMGTPTTSAGRHSPRRIRSQSSKRAVGALPMATIAPSRKGSAFRIASRARVVPVRFASSATSGSFRKQSVSFPSGAFRERRASAAERRTPALTISTSVTTGAPRRTASMPACTAFGEKRNVFAHSTSVVAWATLFITSRSGAGA